MKHQMSEEQCKILNAKGNIVVTANAGAGKTFILVEKINKTIEENQSYKTIAAITFTRKAANEIKSRLKKDTSNIYIGTNDSFVLEEIIRPFFKDIYHMNFSNELEPDYQLKVDNSKQGINIMLSQHIIPKFRDNKKNFNFRLAKYILENSQIARTYLKSKYSYIFIDEYQDSDTDMHNFFMYLNENLGINLFVVGDEKQSIYIWRGANPESFMSLTSNEDFEHYKLSENYRSSQCIKNYAYIFSEEMNMFKIVENNEEVLAINCTECQEIIPQIINVINKNKRVALLTFQKNDAKILAEQFTQLGLEMKYIISPLIEDISTHDKWLYSSIAKFIYLKDYNTYSFLDDIPFEISRNDRTSIKKYLKQIPTFIKQKEILKVQINALFNILDYKLSNDKFERLFETINNDIYGNWYNLENIKNVSMTLHSSKGLEFDQVILLAKDFSLNNQENKNLHYVGITRAKEKMIIIFEKNYSNKYLDILVKKMQTLPNKYKMILNMKKL